MVLQGYSRMFPITLLVSTEAEAIPESNNEF